MTDELIFLLGVAIERLGGTLVVTDEEVEAFDAAERKLNFDLGTPGAYVVVSLESSDLPDGTAARVTYTDGTSVFRKEDS